MTKQWFQVKEALRDLQEKDKKTAEFLDKIISEINQNFKTLEDYLSLQYYQLCHWQESLNRLNYRRFFTVNSLICLKMENDDLFKDYHSFIEQQVKNKRFQGLRIDHIDGLKKPLKYMDNLRIMAGDDVYLIAEKILEKNEGFISDIPFQGTSGYDFLSFAGNLFTRKKIWMNWFYITAK
ncbi:MAG: hypothetical protein HC906_11140 [Bacteroidales bacterium]|nr:hypothetical protein [Bacteroidales bacterium]